jgi:hypothetical protein
MASRAELPTHEPGVEPVEPAQAETTDRPVVVWRTWLLTPERGPRNSVQPLLTGLYGFPWYAADVAAKCTMRDRAGGYLASGAFTVDRHHRVIPDPFCTCGIYAGRDELTVPRPHPVRTVPFATGFVELRGRVLATPDGFRAQQARIVGPLTIAPGRPPVSAAVAMRLGVGLTPNRVVTGPSGYHTLWRSSTSNRLDAWLRDTAAKLSDRYHVNVETSFTGTTRNPPRG